LVDWNADGRTDVLSGSWPGEVYWFERAADGSFLPRRQIPAGDGKPLNVGSASAAYAADWDADGDLDLMVGTLIGHIYLVPNTGDPARFIAGEPKRLQAGARDIEAYDGAPVIADWDGDGLLDLILGNDNGSVVWHRNTGSAAEPKLAEAETLVKESPIGWNDDLSRVPGAWGMRAKPCVADFNGDGRLDLLLGDRCGSFRAKPSQQPEDEAAERRARDILPELTRKWSAAFQEFRRLGNPAADANDTSRLAREKQTAAARERVLRLKREIDVAQEIQERYRPQYQSHGFVWLFLRTPAKPSD